MTIEKISKIHGREIGEVKHTEEENEVIRQRTLDLAFMQEDRISVKEDTHYYKIVSHKFSRHDNSVIEIEFQSNPEEKSKSLFININEAGSEVTLTVESFKEIREDEKVCTGVMDHGYFSIGGC